MIDELNEEFKMETDKTFVFNQVGLPELLCQLAEEASELAQAALKYRRTLASINNPTIAAPDGAFESLIEETADVILCLELLDLDTLSDEIEEIEKKKLARWINRLKGNLSE